MLDQLFHEFYQMLKRFFRLMILVTCAGMAVACTGELIAGTLALADYAKALAVLLLTYTLFLPLLLRVLDTLLLESGEPAGMTVNQE